MGPIRGSNSGTPYAVLWDRGSRSLHHYVGLGATVFRRYWKIGCAFLIVILASLRRKPSPDAIIEEQLSRTPEEQATRIKRRLQDNRDRQAREEEKV